MSLSNTALEDNSSNKSEDKSADNKVTEDVLDRIKQIMNDTGYGKIFINIFDHEVMSIEHSVTKVFKKKREKTSSLNKSDLINRKKALLFKKKVLSNEDSLS
jgi:hypothetical protein